MDELRKATTIIILNISVFFVLLKQFANRPGDWGQEPLSNQDAMYFILTTLSTVGYGDISPKSTRAKNLVMAFQFTILIELYAFIMKKVNFA